MFEELTLSFYGLKLVEQHVLPIIAYYCMTRREKARQHVSYTGTPQERAIAQMFCLQKKVFWVCLHFLRR